MEKAHNRLTVIQMILKRHGINFEMINDRLIADDEYSMDGKLYSEKRDLTNYKIVDVKAWLGY